MDDSPQRTRRLPSWLLRPIAHKGRFAETGALIDELSLRTVCSEAHCPNRGECYSSGTATFLVLGDACTRDCRFCAVESRMPAPPDADEPRRVAEAAARMGLRHVVITMVTRDDLPDGGAAHVAACVAAVRGVLPAAAVEVLASDLGGDHAALDAVLRAAPDVFNHNVETVPRLYPGVRPEADYARSLEVLAHAAGCDTMPVKSGLMLGLGEAADEVSEVMRDLRDAGVTMLTLGQYLQPGPRHLPVDRFLPPEEFAELAREAYSLGFASVASAPFVRSSYRAGDACVPEA